MQKKILTESLHSLIHSKIHDVPVPNGAQCKRAYKKLVELEAEGKIDIEKDSIEQRLQVLIDLWARDCPATVEILKWQRDIVKKFNASHSKRKYSEILRESAS